MNQAVDVFKRQDTWCELTGTLEDQPNGIVVAALLQVADVQKRQVRQCRGDRFADHRFSRSRRTDQQHSPSPGKAQGGVSVAVADKAFHGFLNTLEHLRGQDDIIPGDFADLAVHIRGIFPALHIAQASAGGAADKCGHDGGEVGQRLRRLRHQDDVARPSAAGNQRDFQCGPLPRRCPPGEIWHDFLFSGLASEAVRAG